MSLSGIFDPAVQAFFGNQSGSGGESGGSNYKHRILSSLKEPVEFAGSDGTEWQLVSEYFFPTMNEKECAGAIMLYDPVNLSVFSATIGAGICVIQIEDADEELGIWATSLSDGLLFMGLSQTAIDAFSQDPDAEGTFPSVPGVWMTKAVADAYDWMAFFYE